MKKSKQATASQCVDGVDIVSSLPDPILHLILSGLPTTEEIIRTSVLSRRWRYRWTSIPRINIDYWRGENPEDIYQGNKLKKHRFKEFVYWVLLNRTLDLDSVRLRCSIVYSMSTVGRWIHAAVTRNVKQLHLVLRPTNESRTESEKIEMPHCLVTSCSLEVLRLFLMREAEELSLIDCLIETTEPLCISCLKLKNLRIDNRVMLESEDFYVCGDLQICCPKLVYLELSGPIAHKFSFDSLDSLKKAVVHPHQLESESVSEDMDNTNCELFAKISHVESLSISRSFAFKCIDPKVDVPVSLPNLKTLELTMDRVSFEDGLQFIKRFPNLEFLHLNITWYYFMPKCWKLNEAATVRILTQQLKKVVFVEFYRDYHNLDRACFFLKHGKALEEMVFIWRDKAMFNEKSTKIMNQVSNFHKASSNVRLISILKPYTDYPEFF